MQAAPWVWWRGEGWWGPWAFFLGKDCTGVECGAAQASKSPIGEGSQGGKACGTPKGINVGAGAQEGPMGPRSCCERIGCSMHGTSRSEEGSWVGELLPRGQGPIGPRKAGQEVIPKIKLMGVTLHLFLVSQDHVSHAHMHGTPLSWFPQRWPEMIRDLCPLLGEPAQHWPQSWWQLRVRVLGLEGPLQGAKGDSRWEARREPWHCGGEGHVRIMPEKAFHLSWVFLKHVAVGRQQAWGVGGEVLVGVLVGVLVLVVVLVELESQGPGRAPCPHHLRATLGIQVARVQVLADQVLLRKGVSG